MALLSFRESVFAGMACSFSSLGRASAAGIRARMADVDTRFGVQLSFQEVFRIDLSGFRSIDSYDTATAMQRWAADSIHLTFNTALMNIITGSGTSSRATAHASIVDAARSFGCRRYRQRVD